MTFKALMFRKLAEIVANWVGSPTAFVTAVGLIVLWLASGPLLGFSDTWQLLINTTTTVCTFLMVVLLQNSQNRATRALHIKLDELLRALPEPDSGKAGVEQRLK